MKQQILGSLVALTLLTACTRSGPAKVEKIHGTVKAVDRQARTLVLSVKQPGANTNEVIKIERAYKVAYDCEISTTNKPQADLGDLNVGDRITAKVHQTDGQPVIYKISPRTSPPSAGTQP